MSTKPQRWGIVGGGMLGMTLALRLSQQGKEVTILEAEDRLGGLAAEWDLDGINWDRHYHVTLLSDLRLRALLAELDLERHCKFVETKTGFYTDGQLYSMSNTLEFLRFPPLGLVDKLRLGATILYASKIRNWRRLERIGVEAWLRRWSGNRTWERIWLPLLRSKLGENYRKASASFIWAIIARMYAARRTGLKKERFGYVEGGYARVLERFRTVLRERGVGIVAGHAVECIEAAPQGVRVRCANGRTDTFDHVVSTLPAGVSARICRGLSEEEQRRAREIQYQGIVCASVLLKKPLAHYYVTNITEAWVPFTAVIEMTTLVDREYFRGNSLVYLPKYVDPSDPIFARSDSELRGQFLSALGRMYPSFQPSDVVCFKVSRARHVLAISTLDYSSRAPRMATSVPGLYFVNSAQIVNGTLNVNETVQLAENAVRELLCNCPRNGAVRTAMLQGQVAQEQGSSELDDAEKAIGQFVARPGQQVVLSEDAR
jgi:protoporphyrinogen oxidase